MSRILTFLLGATCGVALTLFAAQSETDPLKLSPQLYKLRLDNERVRVYEYHLKPGEKERIHSHPAGLVYILSGGTLSSTSPDGKSETHKAETGEVIWREPTTHALENVGNTEAAAIAVDLKPCLK